MSLDTFVYDLHFNTNNSKPIEWKVDWADAPLQYKLYRGLPTVTLSSEIPLTLSGRKGAADQGLPTLDEIGHFLWYLYGLTQLSQSVYVSESTMNQSSGTLGTMQAYRRFVPSGGALYPNELYMYLKIKDLPDGVYHYDVAHHRLALIRKGEFDSYLNRLLGHRCDVSTCFGTVFVSTMFWKNFFKYYNFSYRLQGLDTGIIVGQMLELAKSFGYQTGVYFQFLDKAVNHLLGLNTDEESVYSIIPLTIDPDTSWFANDKGAKKKLCSVNDLCQEFPALQHQQYSRSQRIREFPQIIKINEASILDSSGLFRILDKEKRKNRKEPAVNLPNVQRLDFDIADACRRRYSPGLDFTLGDIDLMQVAVLFKEATTSYSYRNDLDGGFASSDSRISLYVCLYGVDGISNGAYYYDTTTHALRLVRPGDHRYHLLDAMSLDNVNIHQASLCVHVVGDKNHLKKALGFRGYRIQQMEAGMLVQRLLLTASAIGMNGHALLGFDVSTCDEIYKLVPQGKTSLIQIPIGLYRPRARLEGGLYS